MVGGGRGRERERAEKRRISIRFLRLSKEMQAWMFEVEESRMCLFWGEHKCAGRERERAKKRERERERGQKMYKNRSVQIQTA